MNYEYTLDPTAEEPIMLIDTHIGYNAEAGRGVMADQFCRELMFLDTMGKQRVQIWMNSVGGSVLDAQQIYNTILRTKTKVDTYCVGLVASSAGFIFQAGRKRYMMDGTNLMMHNPYNPDKPEEKDRVTELLTDSIVTMICSRSGMNDNKVRGMMNVTTWLNAQDCKNLGLCDEIEYLDSFNKARKISIESPLNALKEYSNIINQVIETKKPIKMNKVYNKLNLNTNLANVEDLAVVEIEKIEVANKLASDKLVEAEQKLAEAEKVANELKAELKVLKDAEEANKAAELENKVNALVNEGVKAGKIANEEAIINAYKTMAKADLENTTKVIEALPVNKKAPDFKGTPATTAAVENNAAPSIDITNPNAFLAKKLVAKFVEVTKRK